MGQLKRYCMDAKHVGYYRPAALLSAVAPSKTCKSFKTIRHHRQPPRRKLSDVASVFSARCVHRTNHRAITMISSVCLGWAWLWSCDTL